MDLNTLHKEVCFGESGGKIIWQPRIQCWYSDKTRGTEAEPAAGLPQPYTGMTLPEVYRELGVSARIYWFNSSIRSVEHPSVRITKKELNETDTEITTETPAGKQVRVIRKSRDSRRTFDVKWAVSSQEELKVQIWRTENMSWEWDQEAFDAVAEEWAGLGAPTIFMPRVNIQDLYINTMGTQNAIYALYDWPDTIRAYFRALDECHERFMDVLIDSPIRIVNFGDNIHCGTLTPDLFQEHVLPAYQRRCEKLHAAGCFVHAHWDGDTKSLLPFARETKLDGIEAITPQPQGDVTLDEAREALGEEMFLIDGIPAIYFDTTYPESVLEECARKVIELFAPNLVLGISDEISSTGDIERIRTVTKIVDEYNRSVES